MKILQIKINITLINIYLHKLTQKLITNIKSRMSSAIIMIKIQRIRDNLILKRDRKLKLRKTSFQLK